MNNRKTTLTQRVGRECERLHLSGIRVIVAVSGGADSTSLLWLMAELRQQLDLTIEIAHINHGLRGHDSDEDATWVEALAERAGFRCHVKRVKLEEAGSNQRYGLEETARNLRYDALQQIAVARNCSRILVAHTADDQVETLLHHVLRGTGLSGLRGIPQQRELSRGLVLVRPLLSVDREALEDYLNERGEGFRTDQTNFNDAQTRNRIRHELLPMIRSRFNPRISESLRKLARQADDVQTILDEWSQHELDEAVRERTDQSVQLGTTNLSCLSDHLLREIFRRLWITQNWSRKRMGFAEWQRLADLVRRKKGACDCPAGIRAERRQDTIIVTQEQSGPGDGNPR